jgi:hypothetical protein
MIPKRIDGGRMLRAPKDWNADRDGPCSQLAVRVVDGNVCESLWEPTPAELAALNAGGSVLLRVVGGQPPVMLLVEPAAVEAT